MKTLILIILVMATTACYSPEDARLSEEIANDPRDITNTVRKGQWEKIETSQGIPAYYSSYPTASYQILKESPVTRISIFSSEVVSDETHSSNIAYILEVLKYTQEEAQLIAEASLVKGICTTPSGLIVQRRAYPEKFTQILSQGHLVYALLAPTNPCI